MARIPDSINGMTLTFGPNVSREVTNGLVTALNSIIKPYVYGRLRSTGAAAVVIDADLLEMADRFTVAAYHISGGGEAAGHSSTSRHPKGKAVDISRINGLRMQENYVNDPAVRAIVKAMQRQFDLMTPARRENFGPFTLRKLGVRLTPENRADYATLAEKHKSHVHFSIN